MCITASGEIQHGGGRRHLQIFIKNQYPRTDLEYQVKILHPNQNGHSEIYLMFTHAIFQNPRC